jgi:hypothetical protein
VGFNRRLLSDIEVRALIDTVEVDYPGAFPNTHSYHWEIDRQELPPGTTFHRVEVHNKDGFGINKLLAGPKEFEGIPVLTGFTLFWGGEHELDEISVKVYISQQLGSLHLEYVFQDSGADDDFHAIVDYALVPSDKVRCKPVLRGSSNDGFDYKPIDAEHPVLQGFRLNFTNGDHEMDQLGVQLLSNSRGGQAAIYYNDKNDDDSFSWKVWWVDVSKDDVNKIVIHDRYVARQGFGGRDSFRGFINDCTDSFNPCGTLNHAISQADSGDTINVAGGVDIIAGANTNIVEIKPSSSLSLNIEGGWNSDFTARQIDMNGYNFSSLARQHFDIIADGTQLDITISGFAMRYSSAENGGAIQVRSLNGGTANLTIESNKIVDNKAVRYGGGIYAYNNASTLILNLTDNLIMNNASDRAGGGVAVESFNTGSSTVTLTNNIIADNTARLYDGGALFNGVNGVVTADLTNNTITHNSAAYYGGGFFARSVGAGAGAYVDVTNSIV